jgi:hypothetical protein
MQRRRRKKSWIVFTWILIGCEMPERHEPGESDVSALCYGSLEKKQWLNIGPEMEFLNINLTKDSSLVLLHAIYSSLH